MNNQNNNGFGFNNPDQQMNYNGYYPNQQMNYQNGMYQQEPPRSNRGGGFFSFLIAIILVAGLVVFLLDYTGKIDAKSLYHKIVKTQKVEEKKTEEKEEEKKEEEIPDSKTPNPYEDEFKNMCSQLDEEGKYNFEEYMNRVSNTSTLPENPTIDDKWKLYMGLKYCMNKICFINEEEPYDKYIHRFSCETGDYVVEDFTIE